MERSGQSAEGRARGVYLAYPKQTLGILFQAYGKGLASLSKPFGLAKCLRRAKEEGEKGVRKERKKFVCEEGRFGNTMMNWKEYARRG